jgi:hypothetical protein
MFNMSIVFIHFLLIDHIFLDGFGKIFLKDRHTHGKPNHLLF